MSRFLTATLLASLALLAPLADAQQQSTLTLQLYALDKALDGDTTATTSAAVTYVADATVLLNTAGIPVAHQVTKAPAWATVTVSPSHDVFPVTLQPGVSYVMTRAFTITITVARDAPQDAIGLIEITSVVTPTMFAAKYATAKAQLPIHVINTLAPCEPATNATATPETPSPTQASIPTSTEPQPVHVQSAAPATTMPTSAMALGGFAAVGAGVGFVLRRRM